MRLASIKTGFALGTSLIRLDAACPGFRVIGMSGCRLEGSDHIRFLRFLDDDPSLVLRFASTPFGSGGPGEQPCLLILEATPSRPDARGKLYIDRGDGFREGDSIAWRYEPGGTTVIALPDAAGIRRLRLDPDDRAGGGVLLQRLATRPVTRTEMAILAAHRLAVGVGERAAGFDALYRLCFGRGARPVGSPGLTILPPEPIADTLVAIIGGDDPERVAALAASLGTERADVVVLARQPGDATRHACEAHSLPLLSLEPDATTGEAGNIALAIAERRGSRFLLLAETAGRFETPVLSELAAAFADDASLAAAAPSQLVIGAAGGDVGARDAGGSVRFSQRSAWHFGEGRFEADWDVLPGDPRRIETDFCDHGCTMLRVAAARAAGGFDEAFDGALAFADLCVALREAGHTLAALPRAQVSVAASPPPASSAVRALVRKHGGLGVSLGGGAADGGDWLEATLRPRLAADGLADPRRPVLSAAETADTAILLLDEGAAPPQTAWLRAPRAHRAVLTIDAGLAGRLAADGVCAHVVPPGVDTDLYAPEGAAERPHAGFTVLHWCVGDPAAILAAWRDVRHDLGGGAGGEARLLLIGPDVMRHVAGGPARRVGGGLVAERPGEGLLLRQPALPLDQAAMARLLRGVDLVVAERAFPLLHAMSCGVPTIAARGVTSAGWLHPLALTAEPGAAGLAAALQRFRASSAEERDAVRAAGLALVRARFTARHLSFAVREALALMQERGGLGGERFAPPEAAAVPMLDRARDLERAAAREDAADALYAAFDPAYYLATQPDIAESGFDALAHYVEYGWREGREPSATLTTEQWITANPAVRRALLRGADAAQARRPDGGTPPPGAAGPTAAPALSPPHGALHAASQRDGVLFVGYVEAALGLGQALRNTLGALNGSSLPHAIYPFNRGVEGRYVAPFLPGRYDQRHAYEVNVFEMAPDQIRTALAELGAWRTANSVNVLRGYWELPELPDPWRPSLRGIDEVWAPSRYVADMFAAAFDGPVTLIPPLVEAAGGVVHERAHFGLPADRFLFLFTFDFNSHPPRKNPLGALEAFRRAFPHDERVGLVIKSVGAAGGAPRVRAAIDAAAAADRRIRHIDRSMSRDELLSLIGAADCYVSLHRAEGFGLGMAEAMLLGRPVIATGWSGNADFLTEETGYPIPYTLRPLKQGEYPHCGGQRWAEPDLDAAALAMRRVLADEAGRKRRAAAGRRFIAANYGPDAVRRAIESRVAAILAGGLARAAG